MYKFINLYPTVDQDNVVLDEHSEQHPVNAYGASKRAVENILADFGAAYGLNSVIFRYFNVAGADPDGAVGEFHQPETHLIPLILDAIDGKRDALTIFGTDYDTRDGTCIRDYVHVCDLVDAHVLGLKWLQSGRGSRVFNLGTGDGFSVRQVIDQAKHVTNRPVPVTHGARRPRGLYQTGVRVGARKNRIGLVGRSVQPETNDHRRMALASKRWLYRLAAPCLAHDKWVCHGAV